MAESPYCHLVATLGKMRFGEGNRIALCQFVSQRTNGRHMSLCGVGVAPYPLVRGRAPRALARKLYGSPIST